MKLFTVTIGVALNTRKGQILTASTAGLAGVASWFFAEHQNLGPVAGVALGTLVAVIALLVIFLVVFLACIIYGLLRIVTWSPRRKIKASEKT